MKPIEKTLLEQIGQDASVVCETGRLRVRGKSANLLAGYDVAVDVMQQDGSWLPVRGLCALTIVMRADRPVTAMLQIEIGAMELEGVMPEAQIEWRNHRSLRFRLGWHWQELKYQVRRRVRRLLRGRPRL